MATCSLAQDNGATRLLGFHGFQVIGLFGKQLICVGLKVTVEGRVSEGVFDLNERVHSGLAFLVLRVRLIKAWRLWL